MGSRKKQHKSSSPAKFSKSNSFFTVILWSYPVQSHLQRIQCRSWYVVLGFSHSARDHRRQGHRGRRILFVLQPIMIKKWTGLLVWSGFSEDCAIFRTVFFLWKRSGLCEHKRQPRPHRWGKRWTTGWWTSRSSVWKKDGVKCVCRTVLFKKR